MKPETTGIMNAGAENPLLGRNNFNTEEFQILSKKIEVKFVKIITQFADIWKFFVFNLDFFLHS